MVRIHACAPIFITLWPSSEARGCNPRHEGANPSSVSFHLAWMI
jgi:hypothetical protein